jgi:adenine-specific DNA-methyltransferase
LASPITDDPLALAEESRRKQIGALDRHRRSKLGQFFTPPETARLMASMSKLSRERLRILDAGAGAGALTAALVEAICTRPVRPREVFLTAYELDETILDDLRRTLAACEQTCAIAGIRCQWEVRATDFIESAVDLLDAGLFQTKHSSFDIAILNPPYKKFRSESRVRQLLRRLNIETSNLYAAFLSLAVLLLDEGGELVAITPRSFCNGPYFRPFREHLLRNVNLTRLHVFESRGKAFREDAVLQENLILQAVKGIPQKSLVSISKSKSPYDPIEDQRNVSFDRVVRPQDPEGFIHLVSDDDGHTLATSMGRLPCTLDDLGLAVSTGRVVDFRARQWLRSDPSSETVPLIYPAHFDNGLVRWPKPNCKKPNAIVYDAESAALMVPAGVYVLVRRFSAKEERRRLVAAIFDPDTVPCSVVGFENHVNYYHEQGAPLDKTLARGLAVFLNCTPTDNYFRQFNGHTQVNATDLRSLRYPTRDLLTQLGEHVGESLPAQGDIDAIVATLLGLP